VLLAWQLVQLGWAVLARATARPSSVADTAPAVDWSRHGPHGRYRRDRQRPPLRRSARHRCQRNRSELGRRLADATGAGRHHCELGPRLGYAIIGESSAAAKVYAVGKTITGGTKLHSVYPDRAILDRGGKLEALLLPKRFAGAA
jgi:hypothetical protein